MDNCRENVIEFIRDEKQATVTFSQQKYKNKIRKLHEKYPVECCDITENEDGSLVAHIPTSWVKINPPKQMNLTDLEKQERRDRILRMRNSVTHG
jgi:hypothetical protein